MRESEGDGEEEVEEKGHLRESHEPSYPPTGLRRVPWPQRHYLRRLLLTMVALLVN